ncbi:MAG: hypothetical protein QME66_05340 [Candidatus Eisenbacteria bacterium]|nr:hypothetical protein [Candidatus Eisenbacteria bacterium]
MKGASGASLSCVPGIHLERRENEEKEGCRYSIKKDVGRWEQLPHKRFLVD